MRLIARLTLILALGLVCALLTSRWWLPAALPPLLGLVSVEVASVERLEAGGLRLSGVAAGAGGARAEVDWLELPSEWLYLRERFFGGWSEASVVRVGQVDLLTDGAERERDGPVKVRYLPEILARAQSGVDSAARWLPPAVVERVRWIDGAEVMVSAQSLSYRERRFKGTVSSARLEGDWPLEARFEAGAPWRLDFSHSSTGLSGTLRLESLGEHVEIGGELRRPDALLEYSARFGGSAWWPLDARAASDGFAWPELRVPLGGDLALGNVKLSRLEALGEGDRFSLDLEGDAIVQVGDSGAEPVTCITARGGVEGKSLQLDSLVLKPKGAGGDGRLEAAGSADFGAGTLDLRYSALLDAEWMNALIGRDIFLEALAVEDGRVSGAWRSPEVVGRMGTVLQTEASEAVALGGEFRRDGAGVFGWSGSAACAGAEIASEAEATMEGGGWSVRIDSLRWSDPGRPELRLEAPFQVGWLPEGDSFEERLTVSPFTLRGTDMEASGAYAPSEGLELLLANVSLARVDRWLRADLPGYYVESIACKVSGFRPFVVGSVAIAAEERIDGDASVRLELSAELGGRAIRVGRVALHFSGDEVLVGRLRLPLRLRLPGEAPDGRFYESGSGALAGKLKGRSSPAFSGWLQARTGLRLEQAVLDIDLSGDLGDPTGHVNLQVAEVGFGDMLPDLALPSVHNVDVQVFVDEQRVDVRSLGFSLNESAVQATFQMPVEALSGLPGAAPVEWLRVATGTVRLDRWEMENWMDWMPAYLRRSGRLSGALQLKPPLDLSGKLAFEGFGLRPTESLAAVDQIGGRIRLADRIIRIDEASARLGGSLVALTGRIDLADWTRPRWSFDVDGQNVPIRRTTEMILRSDLDIRLAAEDPAQPPLLSGRLGLRSSTLLVDFDPLAPRLNKGGNARPPFFRITGEPFADWRFDLRLVGESFMRVRNPYFKTKLSADLRLKGSFAEPELLGSVRTEKGELHFPGAKFVLGEGEAYIEASRPNEVQLDFSGIAQKASRVIVMEVSQTMEDPLIQFQSTPPMAQADIVRLLATGSTTGGGVGNIGIYLGQGILGSGGMNEGFADRLTVDVGEETSRSGRNTLGVRYDLAPSWAVEGEYDVYDAYNADLVWSIFKR